MTAQTKLAELQKTIRGAAHNVARQWNVDPDDVEQEIVMGILEAFTKDPDFLDQTDSYIVCRGVWAARRTLQKQARQWNRETEALVVDHNGAKVYQQCRNDEFSLTLTTIGESNPWPTVERGLVSEFILSKLNETDRAILTALASGFKVKEVAEIVGVSLRTVHNRRHAIKAQAVGLLA